jgi:hypothetical protein
MLRSCSAEDFNTRAIDESTNIEPLSDEMRDDLRRWFRWEYLETAFLGVSESFVGWLPFTDLLYAQRPAIKKAHILAVLQE